jgi:hypothetical protein
MIHPPQKFSARRFLVTIPLFALVVVLAIAVFRRTPYKEEQASATVVREAPAEPRFSDSPGEAAAAIARHQADFRQWCKERPTSTKDTPEAHASRIAAGVALATARRSLMERLIREDPESAIAEALTFAEWAALPPEIQTLVEKPFSIVADFDFYPVCTPPGAIFDPGAPKYVAVLGTSDGTSLETFVSGDRRSMMSKKKLPAQGVALGSLAAMRAGVLQPLAPADVPVARQLFDTTQADSGRSFATGEAVGGAPVHAVSAGRLLVFSSEDEIASANERLAKADAKPGLVAASSYLMGSGAGAINWPALEIFATSQSAGWTSTRKKVFLIRVNFSDKPAEPVTQLAASTVLNGTVTDNIRDQSYGKTWIEAGVSANLYTVPRPSATYLPGGIPQGELLRDARNKFRATRSGADAAINIGPESNTGTGADNGLGDYDIVGVTFGQIGYGFAGAAGGCDLWIQDSNHANVYIHEFGHSFGLGHASSWDTTNGSVVGAGTHTDYGDIFDLMGNQPVLEGHFHAQAKQKLGWLSATQWQDATVLGSNTYRIHRIDDGDRNSADTKVRGVRVTKAATPAAAAEYYWLSYRPAFENNINQKLGVYLNWQRPGEDRCWLLDTTPNSIDGKKDSPITLGRTYSDISANAHITALATGGTGADQWVDVRINLGPFPGNAAPVANPIAGPTAVPARSSAVYNATATDSIGDRLAWHWDTKDGSVNGNASNLTRKWIVGGTYSLDLTVSDMKGGRDTETTVVTVTDPLDTWTPQNSGSTGNLRASVWGKGRFVVAEGSGSILTSWDGVSWTNNGKLPDFERDPRLASGSGMFVVVGKKLGSSTAQICYSSDARTWNVATFPASAPVPSDLTYANNRFLAVGPGGSVLTSTNGITWTLTTVPSAPNFGSVAWNGTVWMAMMPISAAPFTKANVWTSANGTAWSQKPDLELSNFESVTSHAGVFYATGWSRLAYSTDQGDNWKTAQTPGTNDWGTKNMTVADDGTMVVCAKAHDGPEALLVSTNGTQWFRSSAGTDFAWGVNSLTFGFGRFLATSGNGSIRTSGTFYPANTPPTASFTTAPTSAPARENRDFVGSATDSQGDTLSYFWDFGLPGLITDGRSTVKSFDFGGNYVATLRVSDGKGGLTTLTRDVSVSDPARTFTQRTSGTTKDLHAIAANANVAVAVGGNGGVIRTSPDGITWTTRTLSGVTANLIFRGAVWDGLQFVIVGQDNDSGAPADWQGCIYTSPDGATWTRRFGGGTERNNELHAVAAGGGGLVAVGNSGAILHSTNGTTWSPVTVPALSSTNMRGVAFGGGTWVITGLGGTVSNGAGKVFTSTNRINWMDKTAGAGSGIDAQRDIRRTAYLNNRFVGSGWYSKVRVSTDLGESFTTTRTDHELTPGLAYGANIYFAGGINLDASSADIDLLSLDGSNWTRSAAPTTDDRNGAVFFKNTFITVGAAGSIWQSAVVTPSSPVPPTLTSIAPATGTIAGGTSVTLFGTNFTGATGVTFGGTAATSLSVIDATTITCTTPARAAGAGAVSVQVTTTPGGTNAANTLFTYAASPTLTSLSPHSGSTAGGTVVTLTGTGFTGATNVTFDGIAATSVRDVTATSITCNTPARVAGTVSVRVTTPGGSNAANTLYTYWIPPVVTIVFTDDGTKTTASFSGSLDTTVFGTPSVTGLQPTAYLRPNSGWFGSTGNINRWTNVAITRSSGGAGTATGYGTGEGIVGAPLVNVGGQPFMFAGTRLEMPSSYVSTTAFSGSVVYPNMTVAGLGIVDTEYTLPGDQRIIIRIGDPPPLPTLTSLTPATGSTAGGTIVTLTGTNFTGATGVTFGGTAATVFNVVNATTITCATPARSAGPVNVLVTTPGGTSVASMQFTYAAPPPLPTLTSLTPATGSTAGGTIVTLTGTNFTGATGVTFGGTAATVFNVVNATTITCTTPARSAGSVNVLVTTPGGTSVASALFTYVAPSSSATLTTAAYTGSNPALGGGALYGFPIVSDTQSSPATLSITSTSAGTLLNGSNAVAGNNLNTGFRTNINLTLNPGESAVAQTTALAIGPFDDGLRLDYNGLTVLDFDFSNYGNITTVNAMFGGGWTPWTGEGAPFVLELDARGLRLMVTPVSGVDAGKRVNVLNYFTPDTYVPDPADPDFVSGVQIGLYNRNQGGAWAIPNVTLTATARVIPRHTAQITRAPGGNPSLLFQGIASQSYLIQRSNNMLNWSTIQTATAAANGTLSYIDTAPPAGRAYYRIAFP